MFKEATKAKCKDTDTVSMRYLSSDTAKNFKIVGEIRDEIFDTQGNLLEVREGHNIVVDSCLLLLAALMINDSSYSGAQYWAVGSGSSSWDSETPNPQSSETTLVSEIGRVALTSADFSYLNAQYEVSLVPTNIIQITHTFGVDDCNGTWREFGLFGGDATSTADSGIMIDKKNHAVITKTSDMEVVRTLRITFQFS